MTNPNSLEMAVSAVPNGQWTDADGELWSTQDILDSWPKDRLDETVRWNEDELSQPELQSVKTGEILLTLEPTAGGWALASQLAVPPES